MYIRGLRNIAGKYKDWRRIVQATQNKVVTIHYTLTDKAGEILDTSSGQDPLSYLHGRGNIIIGLERALEGKKTGEKLRVTIAPKDGYGEIDESLVMQIPRSAFKDIKHLEAGMQFQIKGNEGPRVVTVTDIQEAEVTVDGNHPLAGEELTFDVEITGVREATEEELSHGHVHGAGGHHH
jgi:FKBP-type peptidyl-prolyl cis-trans isomerase SlyD